LFTCPKYSENELWSISKDPYIIIHLSIHKKQKKKEKEKEKKGSVIKKENADEGENAEEELKTEEQEEEEDKNRVIYKPSISECEHFVMSAMEKIVTATNSINSLENDLMPFL
jgi:hypothetical protein